MHLTKFTDYSLRVMIYVDAAESRLVTIDEIASAYRISRAHLMKVTNGLTRAGLLTAVRGRSGGVKLARPADEITLGEVVRATEPDLCLVECFSGSDQCVIGACCRLPVVLRRALRAFLAELDKQTLASVALRPIDFGINPVSDTSPSA